MMNVNDMTKEEIVAGIQTFTVEMARGVLASMEEYRTVLLVGAESDEATFLEGYLEGLNSALEIFLEAYGINIEESREQGQKMTEAFIQVLDRGYKK